MATRPLPPLLEPLQHVVLDPTHLRRVIVFAGLQHGARRGHRVASAFHLHRVEEGAIRHVIGGVDLALDEVSRLEVEQSGSKRCPRA